MDIILSFANANRDAIYCQRSLSMTPGLSDQPTVFILNVQSAMSSSTPPSPHSHIPLDSKLGAAFLGNLIAGIFYGITCVQAYTYFGNSNKDRQWFRGLIFFLWILDTLHLVLITHGLYYYMVSNFGNFVALASPPWSLLAQVYVTCISDLCVRCIFGYRVWLMAGRNYLVAAGTAISSLLTFVAGFIFTSRAFVGVTYANFSKISYLLYISLGSGVVADAFIAMSLCVNLWKRRTGFHRTETVVKTLMLYSINACLLTTVCSIACFVTYGVWPGEFTFIGIYFSLNKLFFNSLLATLNGREALSEKLGGVSNISASGGSISFTTQASSKASGGRPPPVVVTINREVAGDYELGSVSPYKSPTALNDHPPRN